MHEDDAVSLKRMLIGRAVFSVALTALIGLAYALGIAMANWTAPIAGGIG